MSPTSAGSVPSQIGPYRIEREIARGGMGIVYLARDTQLDRAVAIKALPEDVAADPERLARFEREAKTLASLNHPNIAAIYGIEVSGGRRYLVLEHIEGETLAARLSKGKLPLAESIEICAQIAAGVEAAHESGVIHRDLKPGNVMITPGEHVKVLDFGLAKGKVAESESGVLPSSPTAPESPTVTSPVLPHSPTEISPATLPGVILGTAAYLSPEQARGKAVDRRTDIWSFGCVLYECLTGKRVFDGETVSDTIARILERDVDWKPLPKSTPPRVRELLHRCLEKDARKRLRDIGEARLALEAVPAGSTSATTAAIQEPEPRNPVVRWRDAMQRHGYLFAAGLILGALIGVNMLAKPVRNAAPPTHVSIPIPSDLRALEAGLTPDGRTEVIRAEPRRVYGNAPTTIELTSGTKPVPRIYVRRFDGTSFEPIRGTEGNQGFLITHDGRWIIFGAPMSERTAQVRLFKVPIDGGAPPVPIADVQEDFAGAPLWLPSGDRYIAVQGGKAFARIPPIGEPVPKATRFDAHGLDALFAFGSPLPGNRAALCIVVFYEGAAFHQGIGVVDLKSGKTSVLFPDGGSPHYAPTGHLLYTRNDVLYAAPFDTHKLVITGEAVPVMEGLRVEAGSINATFDLSETGTLQITPGGITWADRRAVIVTPGGAVSDWSGERQAYEGGISASPDGRRFTSVISGPRSLYEIWVSERGRRVSRRVISVANADCSSPRWSPDGSRIAYQQIGRTDADGLYTASAAGDEPPQAVYRSGAGYFLGPASWLPHGTRILAFMGGAQKRQLVCVPATPATQGVGLPPKPEPLFAGGAEHSEGAFSPDGRWLAFVSDETGTSEVYVCGWNGAAPSGEPLAVSDGGGDRPRWSRDGGRLYYMTPQHKIMRVSVTTKPELSASAPALAWDLDALRIAPLLYDILPDGGLLGIRKGDNEDEISRFDLTLNFFDELKQRISAAKK